MPTTQSVEFADVVAVLQIAIAWGAAFNRVVVIVWMTAVSASFGG